MLALLFFCLTSLTGQRSPGVGKSTEKPFSPMLPLAVPIVCLFCATLLVYAETGRAAVSIVDDSGALVSLAAPARRIIPLYAGLGDILASLGLRERIIARTVADDSAPENALEVGTHMRPNFELVAALRPDLVVQLEGREEAAQTAQRLTTLDIPVARFRIASFAELFSCMERLGALTGTEDKATEAIHDFQVKLNAIKGAPQEKRLRPGIFFEIRYPNLLGAGGESLLTDIAAFGGGTNCLAHHPGRMVRLSEESLAALNPAIYIVLEGPMNKTPPPVEKRAHYQHLAAVRTGFVRVVKGEDFSRPGPRILEAVRQIDLLCREWQTSTQTALPK